MSVMDQITNEGRRRSYRSSGVSGQASTEYVYPTRLNNRETNRVLSREYCFSIRSQYHLLQGIVGIAVKMIMGASGRYQFKSD